MNILVTGGAGFIGSSTCAALASAGYRPITYDSLVTGHADNVRWGPLEVGDIRDPGRVRDVFAAYRPAAVIHFAASAYVGESVENPGKYYDANVAGMQTLLSAAKDHGVLRVVFSSSCATYGSPATIPITEDTLQAPINPYGRSKLVGEWMLRDFGVAHGLASVSLRYFNASGSDIQNELKERHDPETHLIPRVMLAAAGRIPVLEIFGHDYETPDGTCIRDYVHVRDLAAGHVAALRYLLQGGSSLAVNLGTGQGSSIRQIVDATQALFGVDIPVSCRPRRAGDPATLVADPALARRLFGLDFAESDLETILLSAGRSFGLEPLGNTPLGVG
ncbi:UDP-glucose 4-epimerase GalE [Alsobacter sp. R-9]